MDLLTPFDVLSPDKLTTWRSNTQTWHKGAFTSCGKLFVTAVSAAPAFLRAITSPLPVRWAFGESGARRPERQIAQHIPLLPSLLQRPNPGSSTRPERFSFPISRRCVPYCPPRPAGAANAISSAAGGLKNWWLRSSRIGQSCISSSSVAHRNSFAPSSGGK